MMLQISDYIGRKLSMSKLARHAGISRQTMREIVYRDMWPQRTAREVIINRIKPCFANLSKKRFEKLWCEWENKSLLKNDREKEIYEEAEMISASARKKFNIGHDPFVDDVQCTDDVYISKEHAYIRQSMYQTARHGGFLAVIGESGSGKTTLRRDLLTRIATENLPVSVIQPKTIDKRRLTAQSICEAIMADVAPSVRVKRTLESKARQIERVLTHSSRNGTRHTLVIEEAHDLSIQTLKYLKRFWEMEDGFTKLLSIILIGQPEMRYQLDEGRNYDAREVIRRIEVAQLLPLEKPGQIEEYCSLKFKRIGLDWSTVATTDTGSAIRTKLTRQTTNERVYSMAYPLVINNVIKRALNVAAELGAQKLDADIIGSL